MRQPWHVRDTVSLVVTAMCILLAACGRSTAVVEAPVPSVAIAPVLPTPTAPPATLVPTAPTLLLPSVQATVTRVATAVPLPPATPVPTTAHLSPTPMPTATPDIQATAIAINALFPQSNYDFRLRPIAYQIDNAPNARPQTALSHAYVVYEAIAEGGVTRFTALYLNKDEPKVGNLRSARLVDFAIVPQWDALLAHVGASDPVMDLLGKSSLAWLNLDDPALKKWSWRTTDRVAPYNLYSSHDLVRRLAQDKNVRVENTSPKYFPVGPKPANGEAGSQLRIPFRAPGDVLYVYDPEKAVYVRSVGGRPQIDALDGQQIGVKTIIVQMVEQHEISIIEDVYGSRSLEFELEGHGKAIIFRDGESFPGIWHRDVSESLTTFTSVDGSSLPFAVGNVWVELVPTDLTVDVR